MKPFKKVKPQTLFEDVHNQAKSLQKTKENSMKPTKDVQENQVDKFILKKSRQNLIWNSEMN